MDKNIIQNYGYALGVTIHSRTPTNLSKIRKNNRMRRKYFLCGVNLYFKNQKIQTLTPSPESNGYRIRNPRVPITQVQLTYSDGNA